MKQKFSEEELKSREFLRAARVIFECWEEGRGNTNFLNDWLISDEHIKAGQSKCGGKQREHVVPRLFIYTECEQMYKRKTSIKEVAHFIRKYLKIVYVTHVEATKLNSKELGLKTTMPPGWTFENGDLFARLHAAKIEFDPI